MFRIFVTLGIALPWLLISGSALATPLNLILVSSPDISASQIDVVYSVGTGTGLLTAEGQAATFDDGGGPLDITPFSFTSFTLLADIFEATGDIDFAGANGGGSLVVDGDVLGLGAGVADDGAQPLLTADLIAFGFQDSPVPPKDPFEFLFQVTGGELAAAYFGGVGATVGAKLFLPEGQSTFTGVFTADFSNQGTYLGTANVAGLVPEPGAPLLFAVGLSVVALTTRRSHRSERQVARC